MTKVMSAFDSAMIKAQCTAMNEASKMKQDKTSKFARIAITAMACMAMLLTCVFADGGSIEGRIASGLGDVYKVITTIAVPIAVIAAIFSGYNFFFGGEKGAEKARKTLTYVGIGLAIVYLAPVAIKQVSGWFSDSGDAGVFSA